MSYDHGSAHVYFIRPEGERGPVKIGCSFYVETRFDTFQTWSPVTLELAATIKGDAVLERRFHALFMADFWRGEWFNASDRMDAVIEAVRAGTFDVSTLPPPASVPRKRDWTPAVKDAHRVTCRLNRLEKYGHIIPKHVNVGTYGCTEAEKARRRALRKAYVLSVDPTFTPEKEAV